MEPTPLASYDALLASDIARRDATHAANQLARDARRRDYIDAYASMPIARALDAMRRDVASTTPNAFAPRPNRVHRDSSDGTCPLHGRPLRLESEFACRKKNAWELRAPHSRAHLSPDPACHHPLVRCTHKW